MTKKCERYFRKNKYGQEFFDIHAYEDDIQMNELARMRKGKEQHRILSRGLKDKVVRFFGFQKTL